MFLYHIIIFECFIFEWQPSIVVTACWNECSTAHHFLMPARTYDDTQHNKIDVHKYYQHTVPGKWAKYQQIPSKPSKPTTFYFCSLLCFLAYISSCVQQTNAHNLNIAAMCFFFLFPTATASGVVISATLTFLK